MNDLRYALRMFVKNPGFTVAAAGLLALGIGLNSLVFSALDAVLLRPLPVLRPSELVRMVQTIPKVGDTDSLPYAFYRTLRESATAFSAVFGEVQLDVAMTEPQPAVGIRLHLSTPEFFDSLGVHALHGRALTADDAKENPGLPPAVLSYDFWQRRFEGSMQAIGRTLALQGHRFVIVGVMPRGFNGTSADTAPDVRVPYRVLPSLWNFGSGRKIEYAEFNLAGRLKAGVSLAQAQAESRSLWQSAVGGYYPGNPERVKYELKTGIALEPLEQGVSVLRDRYGTVLKALMACVGVLLAMTCANIAGLLLARGSVRRVEMAVRLSLGATRARVVRQMLAESFALTVLGGVGALAIAFTLPGLLTRLLPPIRDLSTRRLALSVDLGPSGRVLLFSLAACSLTALVFGLAPAIAAARTSVNSVLRGGASGAGWRGRQVLVALQIALCTLLLAGAGLLIHTLEQLRGVDPGFDRDHVATFSADPSLSGYTVGQENALLRSLMDRVRELPGVASAAVAARGVMRGRGMGVTVAPVGQKASAADFLNTSVNSVSPGYFDAMGMRIVAGRDFTSADDPASKPKKVLVNEAFVRRFIPGGDAIGRQFGASDQGRVASPDCEILGVVNDAKYRSLREPITPTFYMLPNGLASFVLHVRTLGRPQQVIQPVRQALAALDPALPFVEVATLAEEVEDSTASERLMAMSVSIFGAVAALLAAVGIYGLLSFVVAQRRREIGIRLSLGARPSDIAALIGRQTLVLVGAGLVLGLGSVVVAVPWVRSLLYGVNPADPASLLAAALSVTAVAAVAIAVPLVRATRKEPAGALLKEN